MADLDWTAFCDDVVPTLLTDFGAPDIAEAAGRDMMERAQSFATSGRDARAVLRAPFVEEVVGYEPAGAPSSALATVCLIVRCSLLEDAHARGIVNDGGIEALTSMAAGALHEWLREHEIHERGPAQGTFAGLEARWPRAWSVLSALARTPLQGGRIALQMPTAPIPELPAGSELFDARRDDMGYVVMSAIEPRFDSRLMEIFAQLSPDYIAAFANLSRLSRDLDKMLRSMEIILSRGSELMTTNHYIRQSEVHTRKGELVAPDSHDFEAMFVHDERLSGVHRKTLREMRSLLVG